MNLRPDSDKDKPNEIPPLDLSTTPSTKATTRALPQSTTNHSEEWVFI